MKRSLTISLCLVVWLCVLSLLSVAGGQESQPNFDSIRDYLDQSVRNETVAGGSVVVFHQGNVVFQTGFGYADIESGRPFEITTPVIVASVSKPLLGTTMFRLAQSGKLDRKLDLAAPLTDYLPEFRDSKLADGTALARPPKVGELLTHTSGLRFDQANNGRIWFQQWTRGKTIEQVVKKVAFDFPFVRQPGTKFAYSGIGTDVLARVAEVATGLPRNEILRTHLCKPLDMANTFYRDQAGLKRHGVTMPTRYRLSEIDKGTGEKESPPTQRTLVLYQGRPVPETDRYGSSGGTVISTAPDLLKWLRMIRDAKIGKDESYLKQSTLNEMLAEHRLGKITSMGLFVRARSDSGEPVRLGHTGSSGTNVWIDFESDTIGIMLTQTLGSDIKPFRIELEKKIMATVEK